ncbi:MAG: hypothetical protein IJ133_05315 [Clostridia bacterium]|nr:hypothetical protein [Clostridia bacterium]
MIVPDTTTTPTILVLSTNYHNVFDITGMSQLHNMTNVTNLTNVTGATRGTNVTSYGHITDVSAMYY